MSVFKLTILSSFEKVYDNLVESVVLPCEDGQMTILAGHAKMIAVLVQGVIRIRSQSNTDEFNIDSGVLRVGENEAMLLVHGFKRLLNSDEDHINESSISDMEKSNEEHLLL